jgi:hypothetical protein
MKMKILLAPSLVVVIIVLMIWFVYPAYTDPLAGEGIKEKGAKLDENKAKLAGIAQKSDLIKNLSQSLNSSQMSSDRETVMNFLPDSIKEYEIIDNLNYLVLKEGLLGTAISVSQPANSASLPAVDLPVQEGGLAAGAVEPVDIKPEPATFRVDFSVQGSYDKIKSIFRKIYGLKRFNRTAALKIEPAEQDKKGSDNLKATASLEFAYFKESGKFNTVEDGVFSKEKFDTQVARDIETRKETSLLPPLQVDQKGRINPFIP